MVEQNKSTSEIQENISGFNEYDKVSLGGSIYLIKRHFIGNRDYRQAMFSVVRNEAKRNTLKRGLSKSALND